MITVGFEKEYFLVDANANDGDNPQAVIVPGDSYIPHDDCGWLLEARGRPDSDVTEALFSLLADELRIKDMLANYNKKNPKINYAINLAHSMTVSKTIRISARRHYTKGYVKYQNLYGYERHPYKGNIGGAGVHISFTCPREVTWDKGSTTVNQNFDWPRLFRSLDIKFKEEIKAARRRPGFYELKSDGRVEYRSLPSNVDLFKVREVLEPLLKLKGIC